jgi:hypothetical protein
VGNIFAQLDTATPPSTASGWRCGVFVDNSFATLAVFGELARTHGRRGHQRMRKFVATLLSTGEGERRGELRGCGPPVAVDLSISWSVAAATSLPAYTSHEPMVSVSANAF